MATTRSTFALAIGLMTAVTTAPAEYASQGIDEAQGLKQVITDTKAPISPEVMAAVVAKVKANPGLTQALIQANPRFKKILGISDNAPVVATAPIAPVSPAQAYVPPPVAYAPVKKGATSQEAVRLTETLSQVNSILNGDTTTVIANRPARAVASVGEQDDIPDTNRFGEPLPVRRLLGKLDNRQERSAETLELKRKLLLQKERKYSRYSRATGGSALQASLEFNRGVSGAEARTTKKAAPAGSGYQLAMRDISETEQGSSVRPSSLRHRKIIGGENRRAKPVADNEEQEFVPHKYLYSPSTLKEGDAAGGGAAGEALRASIAKGKPSPTSQSGQHPFGQ